MVVFEFVALSLKYRSIVHIFFHSNFWPTVPLAAIFVGMDQILFSSPVFWLGLIIIPSATILVDVIIKV